MAPTVFENPKSHKGQLKWQIKLYDGEPDYEPPHVSVLYKEGKRSRKTWRIDLKTLEVMDLNPPRRELPDEFLEEIKAKISEIRKTWNKTYPTRQIDLKTGESIKTREATKPKKKGSKK